MTTIDTQARHVLQEQVRRLADGLLHDETWFETQPLPWYGFVYHLLDKSRRLLDSETFLRVLRHFVLRLEDETPLLEVDRRLQIALTLPTLSADDRVQFIDTRARLLLQRGAWEGIEPLLVQGDAVAVTPTHRAILDNRWGVYWTRRADFEQGHFYYQRTLAHIATTPQHELLAIVQNNLGNWAFAQDRYTEALEWYHQSLITASEDPLPKWQGAAAGGLAMTLERVGDMERALAFHDQAESYYRRCHYQPGIVRTLLNRSYLASDMGWFDEAKTWATEARHLAHRLGDLHREATGLHNLGYAYYKAGQYLHAWTALTEALTHRLQLDQPVFIETTRILLQKVQDAMGAAPDDMVPNGISTSV